MTAPTQDLIDRLQLAATEAKATIRELHEARADVRQLLREVDARVATVRDEVIEGNNELARREWHKAMESINLSELGAGLKRSFDQWVEILTDARDLRWRCSGAGPGCGPWMACAKDWAPFMAAEHVVSCHPDAEVWGLNPQRQIVEAF